VAGCHRATRLTGQGRVVKGFGPVTSSQRGEIGTLRRATWGLIAASFDADHYGDEALSVLNPHRRRYAPGYFGIADRAPDCGWSGRSDCLGGSGTRSPDRSRPQKPRDAGLGDLPDNDLLPPISIHTGLGPVLGTVPRAAK